MTALSLPLKRAEVFPPVAPTTTGVATTPTVFTTSPPGSVAGPAKLTDASAVSTAGIGPLTFGLTVPNAEKALGARLLPDAAFGASSQCIVLKPESGADAVWFTVWKNTVERLDPSANGKLMTKRGFLDKIFGSKVSIYFAQYRSAF